MSQISVVSLADQYRELGEVGKTMRVQWQEAESIAFVARGRLYRNEFHINPGDEVIYMVKGKMQMHYRTTDGKEEIAAVPEASVVRISAGTPHSPPPRAGDLHFCVGAQETRRRKRPFPLVLRKV